MFTCDKCTLKGCCLQPVELVLEDIKRFRDAKVDVPMAHSTVGDVEYVMIDSFQNNRIICPMMMDDGMCSIYDHRPNICRDFNCMALDMNAKEYKKFKRRCSESEYIDLLQSPGKNSIKELKNDIKISDILDFNIREIEPFDIIKKTINTRFSLLKFLGASEEEVLKAMRREK